MKTKKYDKLVRDKIPEIIQKDSKDCVIKNVSNEEKLNYQVKNNLIKICYGHKKAIKKKDK